MRNLFLVLALAANIFAASLLSMSVNENTDSVEINFSFDATFEGQIEQNATENGVVLKISGIAIDSKKDLPLTQNSLISRVVLTKEGVSNVKLEFTTKKPISFEALKNNDGYKLQLKVVPYVQVPTQEANVTQPQKQQSAPVATPKPQTEDDVSWRYIVVVSFLTFLVAIAFYIKKRVVGKNQTGKGGWLLPKSYKPESAEQDVQIISQSFLDPSNKLMLVEYNGIKYLLLVGNTNVVVDRYYADDADLQNDDFKRIMAENERKLSEFLKPQQQLSNFDEYRMKAEGNY